MWKMLMMIRGEPALGSRDVQGRADTCLFALPGQFEQVFIELNLSLSCRNRRNRSKNGAVESRHLGGHFILQCLGIQLRRFCNAVGGLIAATSTQVEELVRVFQPRFTSVKGARDRWKSGKLETVCSQVDGLA